MFIPNVIHIFASGMDRRAFPIEVGLAMDNGDKHCFLVSPRLHWQYWDEQHTREHQISQDEIMRSGVSVHHVAASLNKLLQGRTVYIEHWSTEHYWLNMLFDEAGSQASFDIRALDDIKQEGQKVAWQSLSSQLVEQLQQRSRASNDAELAQITFLQSAMLLPAHNQGH